MLRHIIRITLGFLLAFVGAIFGGALLLSGILGLSTVPEDYVATQGVVKAFLYWLLDQDPSIAAPLLALGLFIVGIFLLQYEWSHYDRSPGLRDSITTDQAAYPVPTKPSLELTTGPLSKQLDDSEAADDKTRAAKEQIATFARGVLSISFATQRRAIDRLWFSWLSGVQPKDVRRFAMRSLENEIHRYAQSKTAALCATR
jgi:hypothetical protein